MFTGSVTFNDVVYVKISVRTKSLINHITRNTKWFIFGSHFAPHFLENTEIHTSSLTVMNPGCKQ